MFHVSEVKFLSLMRLVYPVYITWILIPILPSGLHVNPLPLDKLLSVTMLTAYQIQLHVRRINMTVRFPTQPFANK